MSFLPQSTSEQKTIVIIGAGLSGLAAALSAQARGYRTIVLEKESWVGGKVSTLFFSPPSSTFKHEHADTIPDYAITHYREHATSSLQFDPGATIVTLPEIIYAPLKELNIDHTQIESDLSLIPLSPAYHISTTESQYNIYSDQELMYQEILRTFTLKDAHEYLNLRLWLTQLYNKVYPHFFRHGFSHSRFQLDTQHWFRALCAVLYQCKFRSWDRQLNKLMTNQTLQKGFSFQALFAGVSPSTAYAVYLIIAYMDTMCGVYYPVKGMSVIPETYQQYLTQAGGTVLLQHPVSHIEPYNHQWKIHCSHASFTADAVISTVSDDTFSTFFPHKKSFFSTIKHLLPLSTPYYSPSAFVAHFYVNDPALATQLPYHHTITAGKQWKSVFGDILSSTTHGLMQDPAILITRVAAQMPYNPSFTQQVTGEMISVLAPCANLDIAPRDWDNFSTEYLAQLREILISRGYTIFSHALLIHIDHPHTWHRAGNHAGTPFSRAHRISQTGPFRAGMKVGKYPGIYRAGADTVPGVGIPSVISSGLLAAQAVHTYLHNI